METLITKVLSKHLKLVIKDFKPEQFSVSITKGQATLTDIELNEEFIQEVAMVPTNLLIKAVKCDSLTVSTPNVTRLSKDPVALILNRVDMELEEPEVVPPMPNTRRKEMESLKSVSVASIEGEEDATGKKKRKTMGSDVVRDMRVEIKEAHLSIKTRGRHSADWQPHLNLDVKDVVIQTTDKNWKVVNLSSARFLDPQRPDIESHFKEVSCGSFSLSMQGDASSSSVSTTIVKEVPARIAITAEYDLSKERYAAVRILTSIEDVAVEWNLFSWQMMVKLFSSLKRCLQRTVPRKEEDDLGASDMMAGKFVEFDINYRPRAESENGALSFNGEGFQLSISPRAPSPAKEGESPYYTSTLSVALQTFSLAETTPPPSLDVLYHTLVGCIESSEKAPFLRLNIVHKWASMTAPLSTEGEMSVCGLKVVVDRRVWKKLYLFLSGAVMDEIKKDLAADAKSSPQRTAEETMGEVKRTLTDMLNQTSSAKLQALNTSGMRRYFEWYYNSRFALNITHTEVLLPADYEYEDDDEETAKENMSDEQQQIDAMLPDVKLELAVHARVDKMSLCNHPQWSAVPFVEEGIQYLPNAPSAQKGDQVGESNFFQLDFSGAQVDTIDPRKEGDAGVSRVLLPTTIRLYGRQYVTQEEKDEAKGEKRDVPHLELSIHATDFELSITEDQERYIRRMIPQYKLWYSRIHISERQKLKAKENVDLAMKTAQEVMSSVSSAHLDVVDQAMKMFTATVVFRAEKGVVRAPLHNIGRVEADAAATVTGAASALLDERNCHHLHISAARLLNKEQKSASTEILCRLQGVQVVTKAKQGGVRSLKDALPDVQIIASKLTDTLMGLKAKTNVSDIQRNVEKGMELGRKALDYLDLTWVLEIGDCELKLLDSTWSEESEKKGKKPFGVLRISTFNRDDIAKRFEDMENDLISAKMELVTHKGGTDDLKAEIAQLQEKVKKAEEERGAIEMQLIETKMTLAEWQEKNDTLARQLREKK